MAPKARMAFASVVLENLGNGDLETIATSGALLVQGGGSAHAVCTGDGSCSSCLVILVLPPRGLPSGVRAVAPPFGSAYVLHAPAQAC